MKIINKLQFLKKQYSERIIKMKKNALLLAILSCVLYFSGCSENQSIKTQSIENSITVGAAASLRDALSEIQSKFEQGNKEIKLTFSFAASSIIQKQIEEGAPIDLFISAGKKQMDALENENLIDTKSRINLLNNELVLIVSKEFENKVKTAGDLGNMDAILCIGNPDTVPAGQYAKESLESMNLWNKLSDRIIFAKDVRQVLTYVEKGEVAAGVVYKSDVAVIKDSILADIFEGNIHSQIVYPAAIISTSKYKSTTETFLEYLKTEEAQDIFRKYGFD